MQQREGEKGRKADRQTGRQTDTDGYMIVVVVRG
jgi:hypothetical protein